MSNFYSLDRLLADLAQKYPHAVAISTPAWPDLTFQGLYELIVKTHRQLRQLGIDRGDRVVLIAPANSSETAILSLAIAASATLIPIDPSLSNIELKIRLKQLNPKVVIKFSNCLLAAPIFDVPQIPATQILDREKSILTLEVSYHWEKTIGTFQFSGKTLFPPSQDDWAAPADDAFIIMTSGSTGSPKLVRMTQDALCYSCLEASQILQLSSRDVCLNTLGLFHVHGLISNFILPLLAGGKVAFYGSFQPDYFLDWLVDSQATWYSVGPTIHLAILKAISEHPLKAKNHALRFMRSGSAPSNPQVIAALEQHFGVPLVQGYGMSEIPLFTSTILPSNLRKEHSPGYVKISKDSELAIANESGEIVPHGTVGEIVARGRNVMKSYIDNPVANRVAFREDWFRTGDLGWLDECGYLHLAGRLKEMINRGGNKISPQEVDDVLMQFSEVEEVATFAVAHPRLGEDLVAAIVLKPGTNITEQSLRTLLLKRIADFKIPSQILFVDRIPKGKTGKIQRNKLAEEFAGRLKSTYANPRNELEVKIASLFAQILNLDKVGIHDNFFLLGGDSLTGTQIISRICKIFAINIPIRTLFELPTVADFAQFIGNCIKAIKQPSLEYEEGQI